MKAHFMLERKMLKMFPDREWVVMSPSGVPRMMQTLAKIHDVAEVDFTEMPIEEAYAHYGV